ncbi:MAG: hypothetical protein U9O55_00010 [Patescibacteria group bacterium]|nr:hypothetical protein [Patescibacteria group bacterium]
MQKFQKLSLQNQAILIYLLSLGISIIVSPLFYKFYIKIFPPTPFNSSLFLPIPNIVGITVTGTVFALYFFLTFFIFLLIKNKQWTIWLIGLSIPLLMALTSGQKHIFWAAIFSVIGWALAQSIFLIKNNYKK